MEQYDCPGGKSYTGGEGSKKIRSASGLNDSAESIENIEKPLELL